MNRLSSSRLWPVVLLLIAGWLVSAPLLVAQEGDDEGVPPDERVVIVYEEPRHRLVVDGGEYKVLDVQILPGDTTLWHRHDSPILYTFINTGDGSVDGRTSANLDYLEEPLVHEVTNDGDERFRIIAMASYLPARSDDGPPAPRGIDEEPQLLNPWFRSYRLNLEPGETTDVHQHENPAIIIQVTDGEAEVVRDNGFGDKLYAQGEFSFQDPGGTYRVHNAGDQPVGVVVSEVRKFQ
ncbi:MAG: cupin domain-containing protein [Gemmatimonadota bacterium]